MPDVTAPSGRHFRGGYHGPVGSLRFTLPYLLPCLHVLGVVQRGPWVWLGLVYVFIGVPLADWIGGESAGDDEAVDRMPARSRAHDLLLEAWVPMQLGVLAWTLFALDARPPVGAEWAGLITSAGLMTGAGGITIAHELMHRASLAHRALAEVLMTSVLYGHFCVEHVLGHHKRVGTEADAATARRGEWVYAFYVRAIVGGLGHAWSLESRRVKRLGIRPGMRDRRVRMASSHALVVAAVAGGFGGPGVLFFLGQAFFAVLLLESVDYIEHYGLARKKLDGGRHERVQPHHSWNSMHWVSSAHLFQLTRHSDHHANASRPYYRLRSLDGAAPLMPAGYPAMMLAALAPPLFFRWVDPIAERASMDGRGASSGT